MTLPQKAVGHQETETELNGLTAGAGYSGVHEADG
jgi:hypothetical protein